jgi:hypothetical protein
VQTHSNGGLQTHDTRVIRLDIIAMDGEIDVNDHEMISHIGSDGAGGRPSSSRRPA